MMIIYCANYKAVFAPSPGQLGLLGIFSGEGKGGMGKWRKVGQSQFPSPLAPASSVESLTSDLRRLCPKFNLTRSQFHKQAHVLVSTGVESRLRSLVNSPCRSRQDVASLQGPEHRRKLSNQAVSHESKKATATRSRYSYTAVSPCEQVDPTIAEI